MWLICAAELPEHERVLTGSNEGACVRMSHRNTAPRKCSCLVCTENEVRRIFLKLAPPPCPFPFKFVVEKERTMKRFVKVSDILIVREDQMVPRLALLPRIALLLCAYRCHKSISQPRVGGDEGVEGL